MIIACMTHALMAWSEDIHVSTMGSDFNDGSGSRPLASVHMALRKARELRRINDPSVAGGIHIIVAPGIYRLFETVTIFPEDSGTPDSPTTLEAAEEGSCILSGGTEIKGWKRIEGKMSGIPEYIRAQLWVADVASINGVPMAFRQLWVNGRKAVRARHANGGRMDRILRWNRADGSCWIPTPGFQGIADAAGLEFMIHQWWAIANLRVRKMEVHGDSTRLFFHDPESRIQNEHPWPAPWISKETGNSAYLLSNALPFLDEPGEWYHDASTQKLYYWPRKGEELPGSEVIAPFLENILDIKGTIDHPVTDIFIKGITFMHTGWSRPSRMGHVPHQNGLFMYDAYKLIPAGTVEKPGLDNQAWIGRPEAAVKIGFASRLQINDCRFEHLGSTAIDGHKGLQHVTLEGNLFKDIGGTAMLLGYYSEDGREIHLPYDPADKRELCDGITVRNNLITDAANEDWGCVGIGVGYARNTNILHNEVGYVSYTGISLGWGWTAAPNAMRNNRISANRIHHFGRHNYDCGGIYTLSAQPGTVISENFVDSAYLAPYAHLPSHWFYLYADEGSSGITVMNNRTPSEKFLRNANGPDNHWNGNGPMVSDTVVRNAGVQAAYRHLLKQRAVPDDHAAVNEEHAEVIELVVPEGTTLDVSGLREFLLTQHIDTTALFRWKNHYVIFDSVADLTVLKGRLSSRFPGVEVRLYHDLFYRFDRRKHCAGPMIDSAWDHIVLTADLVADRNMQQEYFDLHARQFTDWPEVSKGFCRADFQQLLLFRNGRQLMLVISIPRGRTLAALDPMTVLDNPRVVTWNNLMRKYQQGIRGASVGEAWVFLEKIQ